MLWTIFFENDGVGILYYGSEPRAGGPVDGQAPLSNVFYTHDRIRGRFGNGDHKGGSVAQLIEDLVTGKIDPMRDERLILSVVRFKGGFRSLNNRRLYAMKESLRLQGLADSTVRIRIWPLDPVTVKFVLANTTKNDGRSVEVQT